MDQNDIRMKPGIVGGLAVVGFVSLVGAGVWLAVLSARYVPEIVDRSGLAAVYLGSPANPAPGATTPPPDTAGTSGNATSTATSTSPRQKPAAPRPKPSGRGLSAGSRTESTYSVGTSTPVLRGLPDLAITIQAIGYLLGPTTDSFVASTTVPAGARPAVRFSIDNIGTNSTGPWRFNASIPTISNSQYQSPVQQSLNPGERIEYTLGFDQAIPGSNKTITLRANFDNSVAESNMNNNSISAQLTIMGS